MLLPNSPFRQLLAAWFDFLLFLTLVFVVVVSVRFFAQLPRSATRLSEFQGLIWLAGAWGCFVLGAACIVLFLLEGVLLFLALGLAIVVFAVLMASRGMRLLRH